MTELLEKVKEFCRRIGGKVTEKYYADIGTRYVSCILPKSRDISLTFSSVGIRLRSGKTEFEVKDLDANISLSIREPKDVMGEKQRDFSFWVLRGYFDTIEVMYNEKKNKYDLSLYEKIE